MMKQNEIEQHEDYKYIAGLCKNDPVLIGEIYQKFSKKIITLVKKNSGTEKDAQDIFQEALIDIYEQGKKKDFKLTCPFDAYLYFICRNKWLNQLRKKKHAGVTIRELEEYGENDGQDQAEETVIANNRKKLFTAMFDKLGESCKNILRRNWKGMALNDIAEELNISYGYARKKKVECIARLTKLIKSNPEYRSLKIF